MAILVLIPAFILIWLADQNFVLRPTLAYRYRIGQRPPPIMKLLTDRAFAATRDLKTNRWAWEVLSDRIRFTVRLPRRIAGLKIRWPLTDVRQSIIVFTATGAKLTGDIHLIVWHQLLNSLTWKRLSADGWSLWQRPERVTSAAGPRARPIITRLPQYARWEDFVQTAHDWSKIGIMGGDRFSFVRIPGYQPSRDPLRLNHTIRGRHVLYFYAADEDVEFRFDKVDLNRRAGRDDMTVTLARADELRLSRPTLRQVVTVRDDGVSRARGRPGAAQPVKVRLPRAPAGVYRLLIETGDDVIIRNLVTTQHILAFDQRVYLADGPETLADQIYRPLSVTIGGDVVRLQAVHASGIQSVRVGRNVLRPTDTKNPVHGPITPGATLAILRGDLIVRTNGLLAVDDAQMLPTNGAIEVPLVADPDLDRFDYFLADYRPQSRSERLTIERTFALDELFLKTRNVFFQLETGDVRVDNGHIGLSTMDMTLLRGRFPWDRIWNKFNFRRLTLHRPQ